MAKFDIGINGVNVDAAEGREAWSGELPPTGSYEGILKILSVGVIGETAKNAGAPKLAVGVELRNTPDKKYDGYIAWGNLNLIESSLPFVNQFLLALTDGSDAQFDAIKKAFYVTGPTTDERKKHITKIGKWNVNSPEGQTPSKVSVTNRPYYNPRTQSTTHSVQINSYLVSDNAKSSVGTSTPEEVIEDDVVDLMDEDDIAYDEADIDADADALLN